MSFLDEENIHITSPLEKYKKYFKEKRQNVLKVKKSFQDKE